MSNAGRASTRSLALAGLAAAGGACARAAVDLAGAAPATVLVSAALLPASLALAGAVPRRGRRPTRLPVALLTAAVLSALPLVARLVGGLTTDRRLWGAACATAAILGSLPLASRARSALAHRRPLPLLDALAVIAGAVGALSLSPLPGALLGAVLVELAARQPLGPAAPQPERADLHQLAGVALAGAGLALALTWTRGIASPSADELLAGLTAGLAAAAVLRGLAPGSTWAPLFGAFSLVAARFLVWKGPGLARMAVLAGTAGGGPLPTAWLRAVPLIAGGLVVGGLVGLAWGPRQRHGLSWVAAPAALAIAAAVGMEGAVWTAGAVAFSAVVWSLQRGPQIAGLLVGAAAMAVGVLGPAPDLAVLTQAAWPLTRSGDAVAVDVESRAQTVTVAAALSPWSATSQLRVPEDRWDADRRRFKEGAPPVLIAELDGLISESVGRAAEAERFAGHLAGLLSPAQATTLVLGDDLGQVVSALVTHPVDLIEVATPQPTMIRAIAALDPKRQAAWLDPRVRLRALHPDQSLRLGPPVQTIVEVVHAPWSDGAHAAPSTVHLDAVRTRLAPGGRYLLALHLSWFDAGQPAAVARALSSRFASVQAWLPPFGADTLLLLASDRPPSAAALIEAIDQAPEALAEADLGTAPDLLSLAVADADTLTAWAEELHAPSRPSARSPGEAATSKPLLHLASLAGHLAEPAALWPDADAELLHALDVRHEARASFLHLLGEATTGNMEAVFRRARALQSAGGAVGAATLEPLIDPHLADGRRAMALARAEGLGSKHWDDALRYATTARMLAPTSPRPLVLLGEIALGRSSVNAAEEHFRQALELDPDYVPALNGQARAARARGDRVTAEEALRKATKLAPRDWRTWQNLGVFLGEEGRTEEAEESLRQAIRLTDGREIAPHQALAQLMLDTDRPAAALRFAEDALAIRETGLGWYLLGSAHYLLGQSDRAEQDFRRAIILAPDLAEARFGVGLVLAEAGRLEQAAEAFRAVLRIRPDDAAARENLRRVEEELQATAPPSP